MEEHLIDTEINPSPESYEMKTVRWWERKRLFFNLVMVGLALVAVLPTLISGTSHFFNLSGLVQSLFYFFFINCCYCAGWGLQILRYYYFKTEYKSDLANYTLFVGGTVFTGLVTYVGYESFVQ